MFTTMDRIRVKLLDIVRSKTADPAKSQRIATALNQIMDLELAIMLETYRKDLVERTRNTIEVFSSPAELVIEVDPGVPVEAPQRTTV